VASSSLAARFVSSRAEGRPLRSVENDQIEQIAGVVRAKDEPPGRILTDLLHQQSVLQRMMHVLVSDAMA